MPTDLAGRRGALGELHPGPLALLAAVLSGALVPLQSRANGALAHHLGHFQAAWWSFGSGLTLLTVLLLVPRVRRGLGRGIAALRAGRLRWWQLLGGVVGGLFVASQTWAVPTIGVTAFLIATVGGQTVSGLLVDRFGIGPAPATRIRAGRVLAAALAVVGVAVAATAPGRAAGPAGSSATGSLLVPLLVVFLVGAGVAVQQGLNGVVTTRTGNPLSTSWINFVSGALALLVLGTRSVLADGPVPMSAPWWAWTGGLLGVAFIALAAWAVQHVGVLLFGLVSVTTQLGVGVVLDLLDPVHRAGLSVQLLLGLALTLVAALGAARARS